MFPSYSHYTPTIEPHNAIINPLFNYIFYRLVSLPTEIETSKYSMLHKHANTPTCHPRGTKDLYAAIDSLQTEYYWLIFLATNSPIHVFFLSVGIPTNRNRTEILRLVGNPYNGYAVSLFVSDNTKKLCTVVILGRAASLLR